MSVSVYRADATPKKRKALTIRLAPDDREIFEGMCETECRTYGEMLALMIQEKSMRLQMREGA